MSHESILDRVFERLDEWRHLPAYQLERRADVFFALFLPEVLGKHSDMCIDDRVIPEFPIKKTNNNQSNKVDYFALSKDRRIAFLVELKTDMASIECDQLNLLKNAACEGSRQLIKGVISIAKSDTVVNKPPVRRKYLHLLRTHLRNCPSFELTISIA